MSVPTDHLTDVELMTLGRLLVRFLATEYWDTELMHAQKPRLCIDGTIYDVTADEFDALDKITVWGG